MYHFYPRIQLALESVRNNLVNGQLLRLNLNFKFTLELLKP